MALAKIDRAPNAEDLGIVEAWLDKGETADTLRTGFEIKMKQRNGKPPSALRYFDAFLTERREARLRPAAAAVVMTIAPNAPQPALSAADQAIQDRLAPFQAAHLKDRNSNPWPPEFADFSPASEVSALADRWLIQAEGWASRAQRRDLKPPHFANVRTVRASFDVDLVRAEEALLEEMTAPDPPEAAD
jgi:hypothetical protein